MVAGKRSTQSTIPGTHTVPVRVTPRGGRDVIAGWHHDALRVRLAAPPVEGRANDALVRLLAKAAGLPIRAVRIVGGDHNRTKRVVFEGIEADALRERLAIPGGVSLG